MNGTDRPQAPRSKHYRVRKEIIWLGILSLCGYLAMDWWMHLNWPPATKAKYQKELDALKCDSAPDYLVNENEFPSIPKRTLNEASIDKRFFFERPQCAAANYLTFEGSGLRMKMYVYDLEKKRRTATIVTTFDKYED